jgi:hypothetical protein
MTIDAAARNLRTAERFLLAPPLSAVFGSDPVQICDVSLRGARFRHERAVSTGTKSLLRVAMTDRARPTNVEAVVVWSQPDASQPGKYVSGVRTLAETELMAGLLDTLHEMKRTSRIEELRAVDRFMIAPALEATFAGGPALVEDLSARGARVEVYDEPRAGTRQKIAFSLPKIGVEFSAEAEVVWTALKTITPEGVKTWRAGLRIDGHADRLRLAIGHLGSENRAVIDAHSLRLKLRVIRARARQLAPAFHDADHAGIDPEQFLLVHGVREELRLNPEEALHWYRRARLTIADPATQSLAPQIASHPDAIAVWEYLDRSIDPTIVQRALKLHSDV